MLKIFVVYAIIFSIVMLFLNRNAHKYHDKFHKKN
jgi:hypothetical protein